MARANVEGEIARLDALSRTRALNDRESASLARLITVERGYAYGRTERARLRPVRKTVARGTIVERIEAALAAMAAEGMPIRAIYLCPGDMAELAAAGRSTTDFAGHVVRPARGSSPSRIYSKHGVARSVRKVRSS